MTAPAENLQRGSATPAAPFRRIAVCVDGSEMGDTLVLHAAAAAEAFKAPLTILRVLEPDSNVNASPPDPLDWEVRQREARADLDRLISVARQRRIDVQIELIQARRRADLLLGLTTRRGPDRSGQPRRARTL